MEKYLEVTGKNEDAAIEKGLAQLGLSRDDVSVEVLERAKTGFLGIGSSPAKVKLTYQAPDEPVVEEKVEKPAPAVEPAAPVQAEPVQEVSAPAEQVQAKEKPASGEKAEQIERFLTGLMEHLDNDARPVITQGEDGSFHVELVGSNLGALIGRRGETLDAIQQLTNYAVNSGSEKRIRVHVDAENYRARREASLESLAMKVAAKVKKYRRSVTLEAMNAYERHVIHAALQDVKGVTTYSVGTEPNRRVVVAYDRSENN